MILGVGVDIVDITRFNRWMQYSESQLLRVFSRQELQACRVDDCYIPDKLAARFAAKEALFKALSASLVSLKLTNYTFSLLFLCKHAEVTSGTWDVPMMIVDWGAIKDIVGDALPDLSVQLSLSHDAGRAVAFVIVNYHQ
jgi:holo-[acyl-carrier protein] synthase